MSIQRRTHRTHLAIGDRTTIIDAATVCDDIAGTDARLCRTPQMTGDAGIYQTMYKMRTLARSDINAPIVLQSVREHKGKTPFDTAFKLWEFMQQYDYVADPDEYEFVKAPRHTLSREHDDEYPYRDCDDMTTAYACLLAAAGIESYVKAIAWRLPQYTHIYNWLRVDGVGYFPVDLVMKRDGFGRQRPDIRRDIYLKVTL
jgi:hypothetical protein